MLLSTAKMKLRSYRQHIEASQVIFCQLEVGQRPCRGVEVMLTLSHTALNSPCCPEIGQRGSNAKQKALHKQLDVVAVNMPSDEC